MPEISNEVLAERIDGLTHLVNEKFEVVNEKFAVNEKGHDKILTQTTSTNGRVKALERWRYFIAGGIAVACFFLGLMGKYIINDYTQVKGVLSQTEKEHAEIDAKVNDLIKK
jgi:hypothetical protein